MSQRNGWAEVRALGIAIRAHFATTEADRTEILEQYGTSNASKKVISGGVAALKKVLRTTGAQDKLGIVESIEEATKDLGPAGRLALCDLPSWNLTKADEVVMLFIHAIIMSTSVHNISVKCLGSDESDDAWDGSAEWPNIIPNNWKQAGNFTFRYELSQQQKSLVVQLKAMPMGELLLVTALPDGSDTPITMNIKTSDFVTSNEGAITQAAAELRKGGNGIYAVLSRAAATQLNELVQAQFFGPILDKMGISTQEMSREMKEVVEEQQRPRQPLPLRMPPRRPGAQPTGPFPIGMPPIGGDDLGPGGMGGPPGSGPTRGGSSLFGPGNRSFDEHFGRGAGRGLPQGVPPGARFDPYGPGRGPPGRGRGRGAPGGPNPDHLRRPGNEDDDFAFM